MPYPDSEETRKHRLFLILSGPGILFLLIFGVFNLVADNLIGGALDVFAGLLLAASMVWVRFVSKALVLYRINTLVLAAVMVYWALDGGAHGEKILWAFTFPMIAFFMLGRREGLIWNCIVFAIISVSFLAPDWMPVQAYEFHFKVRFFCSFLVVSILTYSYEASRQASQDNFIKEQSKLREEKRKLGEATEFIGAANRALIKSESLLKHAMSIAHLGNWEYDYTSQSFWCSEASLKILGLQHRKEPIPLQTMAKRVPALAAVQENMTACPPSGRQCDLEFTSWHPIQGKPVYLHVQAELIRDDQGCASKLSGVIQDITARKDAEEEKKDLREKLARSQKMEALGLLAGGVAHDLNNVMFGIVSYPDYLLARMEPDDTMYRPLKNICEAGQKAAAIVEDLLTLARRGVTSTEVLNPNRIIQEYLATPEFEKLQSFHPQVDFVTLLTPNLLSVEGSPLHLKKTVMNLVSNAAEAIRSGGTVIISTVNCYVDRPIKGYSDVKEGDYVVLGVEDNGIGIETKDLAHIFEPFYTKKIMGRSGTGLGMAVVWGAVKDLQGYINVESQPSKGTKIDVYLPITRKALDEQPAQSPEQNYKGQGERILIVDDVLEQREVAGQMLTELGYRVHSAGSGEAAVDFVHRQPVDLLVLDMIMHPGIDGLETYKRILQARPAQKAIIVSGYSETARVKEAQRLGAGAYVKKPYRLETLGLAIRAELDRNG